MEWASHLLAVLSLAFFILLIHSLWVGLSSPSGPHLSSLTLEATNALLSPLGSHLRRCLIVVSITLSIPNGKGSCPVWAGEALTLR